MSKRCLIRATLHLVGRWAAQTSRVRVSAPSRPFSPLYHHFNRTSGFWPCVKSCLMGGSDKYNTFCPSAFDHTFGRHQGACPNNNLLPKYTLYKIYIWNRFKPISDKTILCWETENSLKKKLNTIYTRGVTIKDRLQYSSCSWKILGQAKNITLKTCYFTYPSYVFLFCTLFLISSIFTNST